MKNDGLNKWQRYRLKDIEAYRKKKREYARSPAERKKRTEYMRVWREKNREKHNRSARESHARNKHKHIEINKDRDLRRTYGITLAEKVNLISSQDSRCAICKRQFTTERGTHVDHCHKTKKIRGILCHVCNTKLAWFETYERGILEYLSKEN